MFTNVDKKLILSKIKNHYNFKTDADFARFLGIKPQVLSNWQNRNTFDAELIYTKCVDFNPEWLLTGNGQMLKPNAQKTLTHTPDVSNESIDLENKYNDNPPINQIYNPDLNINDLIKAIESMTEIMKANAEITKLNAETEKGKTEIEKIKAESDAESIRLNAENERLKLENERVKAEVERVKAESDKLNAVANERNSRGMENLISSLLAGEKVPEKKEFFFQDA